MSSLTHLPVEVNRIHSLIPVVPETPRKSELADALSKARDACPEVPRNGKVMAKDGKTVSYLYATAPDILTTGKVALNGLGLALILGAPQLDTIGTGAATCYALRRRVALAHSSGESVDLGELIWPVLPQAWMALNKAFKAACTESLSEIYRDLLGMPSCDPSEDTEQVQQTPQKGSGSTQAATPVQSTPQPVQTATAPTNDVQRVVSPTPTPEAVITIEQESELIGLLKETGTDPEKFLKAFNIKQLRQFALVHFAEVVKKLKDRLAQLNPPKTEEKPVTPPVAPPTTATAPVTPPTPVTQTAPVIAPTGPTLEKDKMPELIKRLQNAGIKAETFAEFLGVERFSQCPLSWWTWMRLTLADKPDLQEMKKTYNIKTFRELPEERIEAMTRNKLFHTIDTLTMELGINQEEWKIRLKQLYNTTDSTALDREQLEALESRLADYKAKKSAKK